LQKPALHGVIVLTYPRHTFHIFQLLDVVLFGVLIRTKTNQRRDNNPRAGRTRLAPLSRP
jgi:hypothetical protein